MMKNARGYESTSRENWDTETKHHRDNHQNDGHGKVETLSKFGRPKIDGHHELGHLPITCQFGGYVPHGYIQNLCLVPHVENCRTLQNPPEIAQVSRSQATGHNYEALESESLNFLLIFIHLPETGRLTRAVNRFNGFSVRKPASKNRRQKRMEKHFSAFWRVHFLLKHWQQNRQQKVGNSLDQCSARSKCRKNYRTIVFFTRVFPLLELSLDQRVSSSKL